jgi:hypothetical protein
MSDKMKTRGLSGIGRRADLFTALPRTWTASIHSTVSGIMDGMMYRFEIQNLDKKPAESNI